MNEVLCGRLGRLGRRNYYVRRRRGAFRLIQRKLHASHVGKIETAPQGVGATRFLIYNASIMSWMRAKGQFPRAGCLSLELRKAFDTVIWDFMFATLNRFNIDPPTYARWVRQLYSDPTARMGPLISQQYTIHCGTRKGCPLSPLLFVLA
ncbi:hypothetical protein NDU88_006633 [Pleurodeles waltl]|uniref:Reverse transcriptase domain-containing protein n=1 Tax=Pleurodeles waltl TaxID=8319 RepID=A0AAV7WET9_PLEWA|nr:hypothetical protein NDU88_006633 [Pleurodeles waltl]